MFVSLLLYTPMRAFTRINIIYVVRGFAFEKYNKSWFYSTLSYLLPSKLHTAIYIFFVNLFYNHCSDNLVNSFESYVCSYIYSGNSLYLYANVYISKTQRFYRNQALLIYKLARAGSTG